MDEGPLLSFSWGKKTGTPRVNRALLVAVATTQLPLEAIIIVTVPSFQMPHHLHHKIPVVSVVVPVVVAVFVVIVVVLVELSSFVSPMDRRQDVWKEGCCCWVCVCVGLSLSLCVERTNMTGWRKV